MGSLRLKMAVPVVAGLLALAAGGGWAIRRACEANVAAISSVAIHTAAANLVEALRIASEDMGATLGALARDRRLTAAVRERDARRLLALGSATYQELRARHGITHWNYWEPQDPGAGNGLRNLIRFGAPSMRGDLAERVTLARVVRDQALVTGLELGYTGFVLRALAPVRDGDKVVGYAELGRELGTFLAELKARTGDDLGLVLDKRYIDPRRWASSRAASGERNDWGDRDDVVLARDTAHAGAQFAHMVPSRDLPDGGTALGLLREGGKVFARGAFPVRDVAGRKVGAIYVLRDVTDVVTQAQRAWRSGAAVFGAFALAIAGVVGAVFEVLVLRSCRRARPPP